MVWPGGANEAYSQPSADSLGQRQLPKLDIKILYILIISNTFTNFFPIFFSAYGWQVSEIGGMHLVNTVLRLELRAFTLVLRYLNTVPGTAILPLPDSDLPRTLECRAIL